MPQDSDLEYMRAAVKAAQNGQQAAIELAEEHQRRAAYFESLVQNWESVDTKARRFAFMMGGVTILIIVLIVIMIAYKVTGTPLIQ